MKKQKKPSRPASISSALDNLATSIAQDMAHQNSAVIHSRVRVLQCEAAEAAASILALTAALTGAKVRRERAEAMIRGLASVIEKR